MSSPRISYVYTDKNCTKKVSGNLLKKCFYEGLVIRAIAPIPGKPDIDFLPAYLMRGQIDEHDVVGIAIILGSTFVPDIQVLEFYSEEANHDENEVLNNEQSN